ncbi:hypothetical protein B0H11DRAFT_2188108 [Mycena galericulata]|nr:hypothetical protein B0H11DRAFT_2188108 [Mycena galericulata]
MSTVALTQVQVSVHKTRSRALSLALIAASRTSPLLDIPTELGLEILELGLSHTPFSALAAVSKAFAALISRITYRNVVLDSIETMSLFSRTTKSKSPDFLDTHIKTLTVTIDPWYFTPTSRIELEGIIASCTGLRAISVARPGFLALSRHPLHRPLPSEVTVQSFDAATPFEWQSVSIGGAFLPPSASSAAHLSASLTRLRISEPGDAWHSPLSILQFFGSAPHLTHFALTRRMDANIDNDEVFVDELRMLLASRPQLKLLVVSIFPAQWPRYFDPAVSVTSSTIWVALSSLAEADKRVVLLEAGLEGRRDDISWADIPPTHKNLTGQSSFWEHSRREREVRDGNSSSKALKLTSNMNYTPRPPALVPQRLPLGTSPSGRVRKAPPNKPKGRGPRHSMPTVPVASRSSPLLDMPTEIGLEIMELALMATPSTTLAVVCKGFNALVAKILYKTVVLDSLEAIALFDRTVKSKPAGFLETHVRTLAVTVNSRLYSKKARVELEEIVAACTGLRTLAIPGPGILTSALISQTRPVELIIQKFDACTPFEWDPLFDQVSESPAAHLCTPVTHIRICEPATVWHSPLESLEFFGPLPHLTHLALARSVSAEPNLNDRVFVEEIRDILASRKALKMLVVHIFPARWPKPTRAACSLCSHSCLCKRLLRVAETDNRLVLLTAGWNTLVEEDPCGFPDFESTSPPHANHGSWRPGSRSFWENWRMSDKRVVSLTTGWEPEVLQDAMQWTYFSLLAQLRERHDFWARWLMPALH